MSHSNRGKTARVSKAAAAVLQALKTRGFKISKDEEADAIRVAIKSLTEKEENPLFLYFEHDIGKLCKELKEFVFIRVEPIKIGCDDTQAFDAANIWHGWRDNPDPCPTEIRGDPNAIFYLLREKMENFTTAFNLMFLIERIEAEKLQKYGMPIPLHFVDLEMALSVTGRN
jgi:hypothetical protein